MWDAHAKGIGGTSLLAAVVFLTVGCITARGQSDSGRSRGRNQGPTASRRVHADAADPLANAGNRDPKAIDKVPGSYHYTFKLHSFDGTALAASLYPSKLGPAAPVVMLVHEVSRSRRDFEEPITELKGEGLAEHLQDGGYAVFSMDLRGQGQNPRRALAVSDYALVVQDLQAAYIFLLDRHNRGELNIAKLGVIGLGDGANLAAAWAYQPGAAVSTEGRSTDLSALVFISPMPRGSGYVLERVLPSLVPTIPLALLAGSKDNPSKDTLEHLRKTVAQARPNKVEFFPTPLHGYKLLRLEPKVTAVITQFLDTTVKLRAADWEPRYNLSPVVVTEAQVVQHARAAEEPTPRGSQGKAAQQEHSQPGNGKKSKAVPKEGDQKGRTEPLR